MSEPLTRCPSCNWMGTADQYAAYHDPCPTLSVCMHCGADVPGGERECADCRPAGTFTHASMIDPTWTPGPGQRYADGPKARMRVTRATRDTVWFGYAASDSGGFRLDRATFEARYPGVLASRNRSQGVPTNGS